MFNDFWTFQSSPDFYSIWFVVYSARSCWTCIGNVYGRFILRYDNFNRFSRCFVFQAKYKKKRHLLTIFFVYFWSLLVVIVWSGTILMEALFCSLLKCRNYIGFDFQLQLVRPMLNIQRLNISVQKWMYSCSRRTYFFGPRLLYDTETHVLVTTTTNTFRFVFLYQRMCISYLNEVI